MSQNHVIIVAGGSGTRMGSEIPKQFLLLSGLPIIVRSIQQFVAYDNGINIIVVLPEAHLETWREIKRQYLSDIKVTSGIGGESRVDSVNNGLLLIPNHQVTDIVAVHDAVRPLVSHESIKESFEVAKKKGSAIVAISLKDSIREISGERSFTKDRANYRLVQTPQTFRLNEIKRAYHQIDAGQGYTDDASVYEAAGNEVTLVEGDYSNLKITTPDDLIIAEALLNKKR
ncbi:MAG: 2-C-methyl-D-erythritol 4-phosphate cytidylyltransferase [Cyclobacteriaceae bacterium]